MLSDILAAMLLAQLEAEEVIKAKRAKITQAYSQLFMPFVVNGNVNIFQPAEYCEINHHAFWVLFDTPENRSTFMNLLREKSINAYIGYLPLHSSKMGERFGYSPKDLPITEDLAGRIVRLPFYTELADHGLDYCVVEMKNILDKLYH